MTSRNRVISSLCYEVDTDIASPLCWAVRNVFGASWVRWMSMGSVSRTMRLIYDEVRRLG